MARDPSSDAPSSEHAPDDRELVQAALAGRAQAVDQLVSRLACVPAMLRAKNEQLGEPLGARDLDEVTQNTLGALWTKLARYEGRAKLETWAFGFCVNEIFKALQQRRRPRAVDLELARSVREPETDREPAISTATIESSLARLPAETSDVIRARHFEGRSFEEIAAQDGLPVNTVKARYYRGLTRLRDLLAPTWRRNML
jgi:RNA polymerase sigma factor (sigma-70 family)